MPQTSIHALWVDPLAFEPSENGPPYLPEKQTVKLASDGESVLASLLLYMPETARAGELAALVAVLRAATMVHQSHHWQTRGASYYGDHLLFDRLYSESVGFIDQIAERAVGIGGEYDGESQVGPLLQAKMIPAITAMWCRDAAAEPNELASVSLHVERCIVDCVEEVRARMSKRGVLSSGTDNLLQGVADKHEEFVYLLQQRGKGAYSYDRG
jgi:DNA-binding ferritin-like protein